MHAAPAPSGRTVPDLTRYDVIVVASSAGKDSTAMLSRVAELAAAAGVHDRVIVLHNDLGTTDTGEPIEWPGVEALAREHATHYGLRFEVRRRPQGGLWHQLIHERKKWPSTRFRWCTSDQKTSQGLVLVTRLVHEVKADLGITGRPVQVLYCLGLRAEESRGRANKPALAVDVARSSRNRIITRWHPILDWSTTEVWNQIKQANLRPHAAYSWGMSRLSCSLCPLANGRDLVTAARLRPALVADYARAEQILDHRFRPDLSMAQLIAMAQAGDDHLSVGEGGRATA